MKKYVIENLIMGEPLLYFDGPKMFILTQDDKLEEKFIAYWIGDKKDRDDYLVIPTTEDLIKKYKNNEIDLNTFLNINQECRLYSMVYGGEDQIKSISKEEVKKFKMPSKGIYHNK